MNKETMMRTNESSFMAGLATKALLPLLAVALAATPAFAQQAASAPAAKPAAAPAAPPPGAKAFATPQEAGDALIQAASNSDKAAFNDIIGPKGQELFNTADPVQDQQRAQAFVAEAKEKHSVQTDSPTRATLIIGNEDWPVPIPIVKRAGKWYFDAKAGEREILDRRIGANELDAITICRGYVDAQLEYAAESRDGQIPQYAQKIISTDGKKDGLAWKNDDGTWGGPVGEHIAHAIAQGYSQRGQPFHGYYFKVLKGQGPAAPDGKIDYVIQGAMIGGFALVAAPAEYRETGVKTFIVSYSGIVYQKDLGPDTLKIFQAMELYNPDKTWHETDDEW
jgi:Protein of unknown function (DUF2950)